MTLQVRQLVLLATFLLAAAGVANAQASAGGSNDDDWKVAIYPILAWAPTGIDIDLDVPPIDGGGGGGGAGGGGAADILDGRFDGAYLGGISASKGVFRVDADGMWAAVGGDRPERPFLKVDVDVISFRISGGVRVAKDLYLTGGVRRFALKYNVEFGEQPPFERKPGLWDPLVGLAYHKVADRFEVHATFDGGGFGVGSDLELAGMFRVDWKPIPHFGLTGGYNYLYFKIEDELLDRTFTAKQTLHGPIVGVGIYF